MYTEYEKITFRPDEVLVYLRKSRTDDPTLTVEEVLKRHETILDEWSEKNLGARVPEKNKYREIVSGETISARPEMQKVLKLIESPQIKAVLTVEVQRISRGDLEDAGHIIKLFRYTGTMVVTPQKTYDITNEYDRDFFERELKRGNEFLEYQKKIMHRGTILSVSQGNYIGNVPPYGWKKTWVMEGKRKCPTLEPNEDEARIVRYAYDLYCKKDMSLYSICKQFESEGISAPKGTYWRTAALRDILDNPVHIGKVRWNRRKTVTVIEDGRVKKTRPRAKGEYMICDGKHEAIISQELFDIAQEKLKRNDPRAKRTGKLRNPLASLVKCQCGSSMSLRYHVLPDGTYRYAPRMACDDMNHCHTSSCTYDDLVKLIRESLKKEIEAFELTIKNKCKTHRLIAQRKSINKLEKRLRELETKEIAQWEARTDPDPSKRMPPEIFERLNEKVKNEKTETLAELFRIKTATPTMEDTEKALLRFKKALQILDDETATAEEKNRLLKACIKKIVYKREKATRLPKSKDDEPTKRGPIWSSPEIIINITYNL